MKKLFLLLIFFITTISCKNNFSFYNNVFVLDTVMSVVIQNDINIDNDDLLRKVISKIYELDNIFNAHKKESELSKVNNLAFKSFIHISEDLNHVIKKSILYSEKTSGAFDPSLLILKKIWDFSQINLTPLPTQEIIKNALTKTGYKNIILQNNKLKFNIEGIGIDLGAIAKGYIIDKIVSFVRSYGINNFIINIGGDVYCSGKPKDRRWIVGIQDPRKSDNFVAKVYAYNKSVVTSGDYQRFKIINGKRYHHIIDPKTGFPSEECISATVIADTAIDADALSTAIFVMGKDKGIKLINSIKNVEALIITEKNGKLEKHFSKGFKEYLISE